MKNVNALTAAAAKDIKREVSKTPFDIALNALLRAQEDPIKATWAQDKVNSKYDEPNQSLWLVLGQIAPF